MSKGHYHDMSAGTQNQGNKLGDRSCIRQSRLYREYESGNSVKDLLGTSNLKWNPNKKEGVYEGHRVFDHTRAPASESYGGYTGGGGSSPNRKPLGDLYSANNQPTARERYEEYLRSVDLKTSSQPASRSVIGYEDTRVPVPAPDLQQYEREDTTNTYSAYNASNAGGVVSSFAGGQANGGTQNNGNFIGDRSSTRLWAPPGGQSSFSISHAGQENYANADTDADADIGFGTRRRSYKQPGGRRPSSSLISHDEGPDKHATRSGVRVTAPAYGTGLGLPSSLPRQAPLRAPAPEPSHYGNNLDDEKYYRSDFRHPTESHSHSVYRKKDEELDQQTQEALVREAELKLKGYAGSLSPTHGNSLDDEKYYRSDFRHPTESHSHSTYKAAASNDDLKQYEREDTTNTYSAYNASKAGGVVSSFAGGQANGGTQNNGNFIGDRSSTRLWAPPGGQSSISLGHGAYQQQPQTTTNRMESSYPKKNDIGRAYVTNAPARQGSFSLAHDVGPAKHATYNDPSRSMRFKQQNASAIRSQSSDISNRDGNAREGSWPTDPISSTRGDAIAKAMVEEGVVPRAFKSTRDGKHFSKQSTRPW